MEIRLGRRHFLAAVMVVSAVIEIEYQMSDDERDGILAGYLSVAADVLLPSAIKIGQRLSDSERGEMLAGFL